MELSFKRPTLSEWLQQQRKTANLSRASIGHSGIINTRLVNSLEDHGKSLTVDNLAAVAEAYGTHSFDILEEVYGITTHTSDALVPGQTGYQFARMKKEDIQALRIGQAVLALPEDAGIAVTSLIEALGPESDRSQ